MGQQQLLLIVLGVIVVGIAVVVGINLFNANAESATQDSLVSQGTSLGAIAQQYYKKPVAMGGGGNSFTPTAPGAVPFDEYWTNLPSNLRISTDADWENTAPNVTDTVITFTAQPLDQAYQSKWQVVTTVTPTSIVSRVDPL
jgi:hypothetical protein